MCYSLEYFVLILELLKLIFLYYQLSIFIVNDDTDADTDTMYPLWSLPKFYGTF